MATYKIQVSNEKDLFGIIFQVVDSNNFRPYIFLADTEIKRVEYPAKIEETNEDNIPMLSRFKQENLLKIVTVQSYVVTRWLKYLKAFDTVTISNVDTEEQSEVRIEEIEERALSEVNYEVTIKFVVNTYIKDGCESDYTITIL